MLVVAPISISSQVEPRDVDLLLNSSLSNAQHYQLRSASAWKKSLLPRLVLALYRLSSPATLPKPRHLTPLQPRIWRNAFL
jgi:hypothetical protein